MTMIGHDENNEEVHFKVADKRKFNPDGSVKEGVTLDPEPPPPEKAPEPKPESASAPAAEADATVERGSSPIQADDDPSADAMDDLDDLEDFDEADVPGAKDPASFVNFYSTIATNAAASLGAMPHPATGQRSLDLETGKYWLDVLAMLNERTKGNLHPAEARLAESILADLRMQYVHLVRATEEKLKAQAAAKFSGEDILGKK